MSSVLFFTVFFEGERHDLSKQEVLAEKWDPPPPGKPVTFYECHPEDHAPAPSVRADFDVHQGDRVLTHPHMGIYGVDHTKPSSITSPPRSKDGPDGPVAASGRLREVWKIVVQHKVGRHVGSEFNEFQ